MGRAYISSLRNVPAGHFERLLFWTSSVPSFWHEDLVVISSSLQFLDMVAMSADKDNQTRTGVIGCDILPGEKKESKMDKDGRGRKEDEY